MIDLHHVRGRHRNDVQVHEPELVPDLQLLNLRYGLIRLLVIHVVLHRQPMHRRLPHWIPN
jgi:hypothetical protein